jgi:hypothetical protein
LASDTGDVIKCHTCFNGASHLRLHGQVGAYLEWVVRGGTVGRPVFYACLPSVFGTAFQGDASAEVNAAGDFEGNRGSRSKYHEAKVPGGHSSFNSGEGECALTRTGDCHPEVNGDCSIEIDLEEIESSKTHVYASAAENGMFPNCSEGGGHVGRD